MTIQTDGNYALLPQDRLTASELSLFTEAEVDGDMRKVKIPLNEKNLAVLATMEIER